MDRNAPNPPPPNPNPKPSCSSNFPSYPSHQNPNPNPNPNIRPLEYYATVNVSLEPDVRPPGVDSYAQSHSGYEYEGHSGHYEVVGLGSLPVPSGYHWDSNAQTWAAGEVIGQYGFNPIAYAAAGVTTAQSGTEQLTTANPNPISWTNTTVQIHGNGIWKRYPKKTKVVQSAYCDVCRMDCNSKDVLDQHKLGKKHKKNLEKLKESIAPARIFSAGSNNPVIGSQENPEKVKMVSGQKCKKKAAEFEEDLDTKRRKVVEGGAAAEAVRVCTICNVVCNSETVFNYHLVGRKHAAMAKKHADETVATAT